MEDFVIDILDGALDLMSLRSWTILTAIILVGIFIFFYVI